MQSHLKHHKKYERKIQKKNIVSTNETKLRQNLLKDEMRKGKKEIKRI